jgi:uncharacterized protein YkwD
MRSPIPHVPAPRRLLIALVALCALLAAAAPSAQAASACQAASATPAQAGKRAIVRATLCTINAERGRHGLGQLRLNRRLSRAAAAHAGDMDSRNYFAHDSLDGGSFVDRIRRAGYLAGAKSWAVGENIAWGSRGRGAPRMITQMWMNSPGHRANILSSSFREIGIGVSDGAPVSGLGAPAATYATDFGARR